MRILLCVTLLGATALSLPVYKENNTFKDVPVQRYDGHVSALELQDVPWSSPIQPDLPEAEDGRYKDMFKDEDITNISFVPGGYLTKEDTDDIQKQDDGEKFIHSDENDDEYKVNKEEHSSEEEVRDEENPSEEVKDEENSSEEVKDEENLPEEEVKEEENPSGKEINEEEHSSEEEVTDEENPSEEVKDEEHSSEEDINEEENPSKEEVTDEDNPSEEVTDEEHPSEEEINEEENPSEEGTDEENSSEEESYQSEIESDLVNNYNSQLHEALETVALLVESENVPDTDLTEQMAFVPKALTKDNLV